MRHPFAAAAALLAASASMAQPSNCESLRAQIEGKFRAGGSAAFKLTIVDAGAAVAGRTVGSCERGSKRIVYEPLSAAQVPASRPAAAAAAQPKRQRSEALLTECRDGTVKRGGDCPK